MALSICPIRTVSSVLNIYRFMCPMPTILNMSEKLYDTSLSKNIKYHTHTLFFLRAHAHSRMHLNASLELIYEALKK